MDASIINTAITACTSLVTCLVGIQSGKQSSNSSSAKTIQEQQLKKIFLPIDSLFEFSNIDDINDLFINILSIIEEQYLLVPPDLYAAFKEISKSGSPDRACLEKFKEINSAFFNVTKKLLGYPYDANAVHNMYMSNYQKNGNLRQVISILLCLISLVLIAASGISDRNYIYALISTFLSIVTCLIFALRFYKKIF